MATVTATLQSTPGTINEGASYKREIIIDWQNIVGAGTYADNDTATYKIPVLAGEIVEAVGVKLITAFNDSGSGDELNVEVGLTGGDVDGFISTAAIHTDQSEISYVVNTGAFFSATAGTDVVSDITNTKIFTANDTIDILITPNVSTGTDYNLNELNAGKFKVVAYFRDLN